MKDNPEPSELRELIRAKIDIYGLTQEDIEDIRALAQGIVERKNE